MVCRLALALILALLSACRGQPPLAPFERQTGMQLYMSLCASCHGAGAQGDGPVAPLITTGMPDLTRLALCDGGEFPTEDMRRTIDGRYERPRARAARQAGLGVATLRYQQRG